MFNELHSIGLLEKKLKAKYVQINKKSYLASKTFLATNQRNY